MLCVRFGREGDCALSTHHTPKRQDRRVNDWSDPVFRVVRWCVKPERGEPAQFYSEEEALSAAERMRRRAGLVKVYRVEGWPVQDLWDRPRLVKRLDPTAA